MALLLDTETLDPSERAEAVVAAMRAARVPAELTHEPADDAIHARIDLWELGGGVTLMRRTSSGIRLRRTPKQVRSSAADRIALTVLGPGRWRFAQHDVDRVESSDAWQTILVDQAAPYDFARIGTGATCALSIDHAALGLPADTVRAAAARLPSSPLLPLMSQHVLHLVRVIDQVESSPAMTMLGAATAELFRALMVSAVPGSHAAGDLPSDALVIQTQQFIQRHIRERSLTPERIARQHGVSLRWLYTAWSQNQESLASYVITQRLELARRMLSGSRARARTIASIARDCGFVDTPHFSRRFRDAYGMSPREWRELSRHASR